jgi:DNA-binding protein H-NS
MVNDRRGRYTNGATDKSMETRDLKSMSVDQLWKYHEELIAELNHKMAAEKSMLEKRLRKLGFAGETMRPNRARRPYPKVLPKYRNPKNPSETWAGRGKRPRWLRAQLRSGRKMDDFRISGASA